MCIGLLVILEMIHEPFVILINVLHHNVKVGRILQQLIDTYYVFLVKVLIYRYFLSDHVLLCRAPISPSREFLLRNNLDCSVLLISYLFALCEHSSPESIS